jgi:hypothetical protein
MHQVSRFRSPDVSLERIDEHISLERIDEHIERDRSRDPT